MRKQGAARGWSRTAMSRNKRSPHDGRVIRIRLTEKEIRPRDRMTTMHQRHAEMRPQAGLSATALKGANDCAPSRASGSEPAISYNGRRNSPPEFCSRPSSVRTLATKCRRSIGLCTRAAAMIGRWTAYEKSRSACPSMQRADCLLKLPSWYLQPDTRMRAGSG